MEYAQTTSRCHNMMMFGSLMTAYDWVGCHTVYELLYIKLVLRLLTWAKTFFKDMKITLILGS